MNILIVDDNKENRYLLSALLRGSGHLVAESENGADAMEKLRTGGFDLLISDILMPVMDGFQLIQTLKSDEALRQTPVIVYTATYTGPEDEAFALKIGADRFIQKPCEPEVFMDALNEVMAGAGGRAVPALPLPEEEVFKLYNERLIRKLEQKMFQLEQEGLLRQEAAQALQISEKKYRKLHESMMDGFVRVDMQGTIMESNESYQRMVGYDAAELSGLTYTDLTPEKWRDYEKTIVATQILPRGYSDVYEKEYRKKDGSIFPVELRTFLIRNDSGEHEGMWAIVRDITARKQADEALRLANDIIVRSPAVAFVWKNKRGWPVEYASENVRRLFGWAAEDFISGAIPYADVIHPHDLDRVADEVRRSSADPEAENISHTPYRIVDRAGAVKWVEDLTAIRRNESRKIVAYEGLLIDVTERMALEHSRQLLREQLAQAQKMESVGRLAGGVAHDFNNLLSVIMGYGEMMKMDIKKDNPHHEMLDEILQAAIRAKDLTRQLLAFSRKQVLETNAVDVSGVVTGFEKLIRRLIGEDIKLELSLFAAPLVVRADTAQLEQVLMNLAVNARDAMPDGGHLTIETASVELDETYAETSPDISPGMYAMIGVSDTGQGMDRETQARIFEPFFTTKSKESGTGLGLATSYGIIKQHGGNILVYSEPEKGSTFKIYLPIVSEKADKKAEAPRAEPMPAGDATIMVIEDEKAVRNLVCRMLGNQGYTVIESHSVMDAIARAEAFKGPIHLVLADVVMPEMKGPEVFEKISIHHPESKVLYVSGYTDNVIVRHGMLADGVQFLQKPFTIKALLSRVAHVLEKG
ncbi:MAG: response regulator [Deltaproteobacteria bacterium]|nr:response regulator [Deltaproteobacteria bacterium]